MESFISNYLKKMEPKLCILSTVDLNGKPQSAVMAYAVQKDLTIILSTHDDSRKWKNIGKNPSVALVFGWDFSGNNIQYEGIAEQITNNDEIEDIYYSANPKLIQFRDQIGTVYMRIRPTWVRLTDFSIRPPKIQEKSYSTTK